MELLKKLEIELKPVSLLGLTKATADEAPRSELREIRAELRRSLTRLRSIELPPSSRLRRDESARFALPSYRLEAFGEDRSSLQQAAGYSGQGE